METERRTFELEEIEIREVDGHAPVLAGYAVVFDSWSEVMVDARGRQFRERIAPTAFDRMLAGNADIRALWNHNADLPLGRTRNGTLALRKDGYGLRIELMPPATSWGRDAVESIRRGDVSGMSFAFAARRDGGDTWARATDGTGERTLLDVDLYEVSPVTFPAYPATAIGVRSAVVVPDFGDESDSRAAGEIEQGDGDRAVVGVLREQIEILRRR